MENWSQSRKSDSDAQKTQDDIAISVAMATFNGAKYIEKQLDSLLNQTLLPKEIVISDDNSTDETLRIVETYSSRTSVPVRVFVNKVNLGFGDNFLRAATLTNESWISFCDQDDIWREDKIERIVSAIRSNSNCLMIAHPSRVLEQERATDRIVGARPGGVYAAQTLDPLSVINGHCITFNRILLDVINIDQRPRSVHDPDRLMPHDDWITFLAASLGQIVIVDEPLVLYRHHSSNLSNPASKHHDLISVFRRSKSLNGSFIKKDIQACRDRISQLKHLNSIDQRLMAHSREAVDWLGRMTAINEKRLQFWDEASFSCRLCQFAALLANGSYRSTGNSGVGLRNLAKDALGLIFGGQK